VADHSELVARIQGLCDSGCTLQDIADTLNREAIPTRRGAAQWRVSAVQSALGYQRPRKAHTAADLPEVRRSEASSHTEGRLIPNPPTRARRRPCPHMPSPVSAVTRVVAEWSLW
jgi:hypothetical protein